MLRDAKSDAVEITKAKVSFDSAADPVEVLRSVYEELKKISAEIEAAPVRR
jgi:hypothetical protein